MSKKTVFVITPSNKIEKYKIVSIDKETGITLRREEILTCTIGKDWKSS